MKISFSIPPPASAGNALHLAAEAGADGISFLFFTKEPFSACGFYAYHFDGDLTPLEYSRCLKQIANENTELRRSFLSVNIFYNFSECVLSPNELFSVEKKAAFCEAIFGADHTGLYFHEPVKGQNITAVYRVAQPVFDQLMKIFPAASFSHASSLQQAPVADDSLFCIFYHSYQKMILVANGKLQAVQYARYNSPADSCRHLLNLCERFESAPGSLSLKLRGLVHTKSQLYNEIYRYFPDISTEDADDGIPAAGELAEQPSHFFGHLTASAKCV